MIWRFEIEGGSVSRSVLQTRGRERGPGEEDLPFNKGCRYHGFVMNESKRTTYHSTGIQYSTLEVLLMSAMASEDGPSGIISDSPSRLSLSTREYAVIAP